MQQSTGKMLDEICPFVFSPSEDCYCIKMNSEKIKSVVAFCMGKYLECKIYGKLSGRPCEGITKRHEPSGSFEYDDGQGY